MEASIKKRIINDYSFRVNNSKIHNYMSRPFFFERSNLCDKGPLNRFDLVLDDGSAFGTEHCSIELMYALFPIQSVSREMHCKICTICCRIVFYTNRFGSAVDVDASPWFVMFVHCRQSFLSSRKWFFDFQSVMRRHTFSFFWAYVRYMACDVRKYLDGLYLNYRIIGKRLYYSSLFHTVFTDTWLRTEV